MVEAADVALSISLSPGVLGSLGFLVGFLVSFLALPFKIFEVA